MATSGLLGALRTAGLRLTTPRRAVIDVLERRRQHLSAEDVYSALRERGVRVDRSSVYRTLDLLSQLGLVRQVAPSERHAHFELDHEEEVHLTCAQCGRIIEAHLPKHVRIGRSLAALARRRRFQVTRFGVEAQGWCESCRPRQAVRKESEGNGAASKGLARG